MDTTLALGALWIGTGVFSGVVDSIAGGGGLITLPMLLATGIPPHLALGTNKLQAMFGSGSATFHFASRGLIRFRECKVGIVFTFAGAWAGSLTISYIHPSIVGKLIPLLLVVLLCYTLAKPRLGEQTGVALLKPAHFYPVAGLLLGFYDGFFGPGTGSFWAMAFVAGLGFNFVIATAHTKLMNFTSNLASGLFFAMHGTMLLVPGLLMGLGQLAGAQIGARLVLHKGIRIIRPLYFTMVAATLAKLVVDFYRG